MQSVDNQPCFILHVRAYRDTSAIIDVLSRDYGRLSMVAKGLRGSGKQRQSWRAGLQVFNRCLLSWQGRGDLKNVRDVQFSASSGLRAEAVYCGFYVNELLERLLHRHDPHPEIFLAYSRCLTDLAALDSRVNELMSSPLRRFEFALLDALGYGIYLESCADTGAAPEEGVSYCYEPESGLRRARSSDKWVFSGEDLLSLLNASELSGRDLAVARRLTHIALTPLLGDRPLNSRALFRKGIKQ